MIIPPKPRSIIMNITDLSAEQLRQAAQIKDQITTLEKQLQALLGNVSNGKPAEGGMSAAGRARISAAAKARWAKIKKDNGTTAKTASGKRSMSKAAKDKISAAAKARWAKIKAEKAKTK
jgi:hypothetical protein